MYIRRVRAAFAAALPRPLDLRAFESDAHAVARGADLPWGREELLNTGRRNEGVVAVGTCEAEERPVHWIRRHKGGR